MEPLLYLAGMKQELQLVECPRDAMQGWKNIISTSDKVRYANALLKVGFHTLDIGSFVSPKLIPQMADTGDVLRQIDTSHRTKLLVIVANERGAEEALRFRQVHFLGFPFSVSPTFQMRNTNSTPEASLERVASIRERCEAAGKELVVYLSMGFGNPYGDPYGKEILVDWMCKLSEAGVKIMSIADTVGLASPALVREIVGELIPVFPGITVGVHLHSTTAGTWQKTDAAFMAGCRRFDGAIGGIGGCPMADDELVGNMDTVQLVSYMNEKGLASHIDPEALAYCVQLSKEIFV